ncbi:Myg1, partial [Symbiodinium pilosum]
SAMCGQEFLEVLSDVVESWLPARACVEAAMAVREEVHSSGQVLRLSSGKLPWRGHIFDIERELGIEGHIKFIVYPEEPGLRWRFRWGGPFPSTRSSRGRSLLYKSPLPA